MARKLFCEYGPVCYKISKKKEALKKDTKDFFQGRKFATKIDKNSFEHIWKGDTRIILRELHGVDMQLQVNKKTNLILAAEKLDGIVIEPGQEFSFWNLVGETSAKKGYLEGLVINNGKLQKGVGGGVCQMANMIHWLVLHSPLQVSELHHHSDALFPDSKRRVPFGTGTSVCYKAVDYRFKNTTDTPVQLRIWVDDNMLCGELRAGKPLDIKYRIFEEDNHYSRDTDGLFYRNSRIYRVTTSRETGEEINRELILKNHSKVLYDYSLIPEDEIR